MTLDMKDIEERERLAKDIARTSESIRKKHRAMKTGRMVEEAELEKHFKPIVEPLKQIAENIGDDSVVTVRLSRRSDRLAGFQDSGVRERNSNSFCQVNK